MRQVRRVWAASLAVVAIPAVVAGTALVTMPAAAGVAPPALLSTCPPPSSGVQCSLPVTPSSSSPTATPPPSAPAGLVGTYVPTGSVTLTWTASTSGCCSIVGYTIIYNRAFTDIVWQLDVGNVTTATISGLSRDSEYRFSVIASDDRGRRSTASNVAAVMTPATDTGPDTITPQAPGGLALSVVTASSAVLTWAPSTDNVGVIDYQVFSFDGLFGSALLATVTGTRHMVPLSPGYNSFYVRARDAAGNRSAAGGPIIHERPDTPTTPPPSTCRVTYTTQSQWATGFVATVTVHNAGIAPVGGWTVRFTFPGNQRITSAWNGTFVQDGAAVTVSNAGWNQLIPPGGSTSFGMYGSSTASQPPPTSFTLNGAPCVTAGA
ncbi:cellulose binding domain-containing protein [Phytohabitans houttuyneae]|uniref:CBM2 domain-containing protein n=1 Tax=Phytohabitans houttuyneae TaxID=1076126 RepID=A0A6V8KEI5_9ACTN|nr:cellulose binding domain-containing protein [Phytohabitans houttuyneae]GFJ80861.1 hypothetical protein Phou_050410 [Phytohabitans houttuyneae]